MGKALLIPAEEIDINKKIKLSGKMVSICIMIAIPSFLVIALMELYRGTFSVIGIDIAEAFNAFSSLSRLLLLVFVISMATCLSFLVQYLNLIRKK